MTKYECLSVRRLTEKRLNQLMEMYKDNIFRALSCELNQMKTSVVDFYWLDQIINENLTPERFIGNFSELLTTARRQNMPEESELVDKSIQMNSSLLANSAQNFDDQNFDAQPPPDPLRGQENFNYTLSGTKTLAAINLASSGLDHDNQDYELELREISCSNIVGNKTTYMDQASYSNLMNNTGSNNLPLGGPGTGREGDRENFEILKGQILGLQRENENLKAIVVGQEEERKVGKGGGDGEEGRGKELEELERLRGEVDNWISMRDQAREGESVVKEELEKAYEKILGLNGELDTKELEVERLLVKLKDSNKSLAVYEDMMNEVGSYKGNSTSHIANVSDPADVLQLETLKKDLGELKQELQIETNRNNYLRKFNEEVSEDLARSKKEQERLLVVETKNLQLLDDGAQKMVFLSEENDKLKEEFGIRISNYDTIKRELEKIKNGNSDVIDKISELTTKNSQLLTENSDLKSEIHSGLGEFEILQKKYEDVVSENEVYENEIKTSSASLITAQENLERLESNLTQKFSLEKTDLLQKTEKFSLEKTDLLQAIENLTSQISSLTKSESDASILKVDLKKAEDLQKQLENENLE